VPRFSRTRAIVLRSYDYSESSQVLALLTREHGRVQVLAKGSRRVQKRRVPGFLDLLTRVDAVLIPKGGGVLSTLTEFDVLDDYPRMRGDLHRVAIGLLSAELMTLGAPEHQRDEPLYLLEETLLGILEKHAPGPSLPAVTLAFELRFLKRIGVQPELDRCVDSGVPRERARRALFSAALGGFLSGERRAADPRALEVSRPVLAVLATLARSRFESVLRTTVAPSLYREARRVLDRYHEHVLERRLRSTRFLELARSIASRSVEGRRVVE